MRLWWLVPLAAGVSTLLTEGLRRYALARNLLDLPGHRRAHTVPTPRGGGVAIVATFLAAVAVLASSHILTLATATALLGGGAIVALIGFVDDHRDIAARWRLLAHFTAAAWALFWLGGLPPIDLAGWSINLSWPGHVLAVVGLVWLLNLYNFMDGIDGIAATEAVTVGLSVAFVSLLGSPAADEWLLPVLLAASALGFLAWNWPPAKIFMGDAGSGFLGLMIGVLAVEAAWRSPELLWIWVILTGAFVVDATLTLVRRMQRQERLFEAHASHAYQHMARRFRAHRPVTITIAVINLLWLLPVAVLVRLGSIQGFTGVLIAYAPLIAIGLWCHAGAPVPPLIPSSELREEASDRPAAS